MSVEWIGWAWKQDCSSAGEKLTLIALADHAGVDGVAWPATARLSERTGQGRSSIQRQLNGLEDKGLLRREHRFREDGSQTSSVIRLGSTGGVPDRDGGAPNREGRGPQIETGGCSPVTHHEPSLEPSVRTVTSLHDAGFELFWATYGKVGPKKVARQCWDRALKKATVEEIQDGLERWVAYWRSPGAAKVKWPQGWLNEERWNDVPPTALASMPKVNAAEAYLLRRMNGVRS
jgi:hypothetical protein